MAAHFDLHAYAYAHRGLWTNQGIPENSLGAFAAAREARLGIEFDVRPSKDGEIMVFHDPLLARMSSCDSIFEGEDAELLSGRRLNGTDETIPRFENLLSQWAEELPLLTEMKIDGQTDPIAFARTVGARLLEWPGKAAAMSFSEAAVAALPANLMRGQLIYPAAQIGEEAFAARLERAQQSGVDYLALHHSDLDRAACRSGKATLPVVTWTVRTPDDLQRARSAGAALIFEHLPLEMVR
jgi:glycerophosphoryl diester phosphodiesterase